jgi:hypothetical protein
MKTEGMAPASVGALPPAIVAGDTDRGVTMEGILEELLEGTGWSTDGYGDFDSNLVHDECGTMVEMDCDRCPEDGAPNPIRAMGLI